MKLIRPQSVTTAMLTTTNIIEAAPAEWSSITTYASGAQVGITSGYTVTLYQSLAAANTGNSPATSPAWWTAIGTTYAEYDSAAVYGLGDRVINLTDHHVYESAQAANTGHALTDAAWWIDAGATNRWAMFDTTNGTTTAHPSSIDVTLAMSSRIDGIALLNVSASTVQVILTDATDGVVYNQTQSLTSTTGIDDWYSYLFDEVVRRRDVTFYDLPPYGSLTVQIIIDGGGSAVECGTCILGLVRQIGGTSYGAGVGINDYSRKETDVFGNYSITERAFSKRGDFRVTIENTDLDEIVRILAAYRATPIVYDGTGIYGSTLVFGFYKNFSVEIAYPTKSFCTLEVEGLT